MHLLAPNVTSEHTLGESMLPGFAKDLDLMNPHSES